MEKFLFPLPFFSIIYKSLGAACGMGIITYLLKDYNIAMNVAVSALIYGALILILRAVTYDELGFLASLIRGDSDKGAS